MRKRKIYYRRKNKKIIIEGKRKNKVIYFLQLPKAENLLRLLIGMNLGDPKETKNQSFLSKEKIEKFKTLLESLDFKEKS